MLGSLVATPSLLGRVVELQRIGRRDTVHQGPSTVRYR